MPAQWDVELYEARHSFVWTMVDSLIELLAPQAGETIFDLGCGSGQLSAKLAESGASVIGIDKSPSMIAQARANYPNLEFHLADATSFDLPKMADAVFSNAALHWVRESRRAAVNIFAALKPGGRFVAEFGGKGNVRMILKAVAKELGDVESGWYFPGVAEYASTLEEAGFEVTDAFLFDRPTPLEGEDGMENWLDMFGEHLLANIPVAERGPVRKRIAERLRPHLYREGKWVADYRRLRVRAQKPVQ